MRVRAAAVSIRRHREGRADAQPGLRVQELKPAKVPSLAIPHKPGIDRAVAEERRCDELGPGLADAANEVLRRLFRTESA